MDEAFTVQISSNLINRLVNEDEKSKKKTKKTKAKAPPRNIQQSPTKAWEKEFSKDSEAGKEFSSGKWSLQAPSYLPVSPTPTHSAHTDLDAIRSVLQESEKVVERLQKHEEDMMKEVTQKAKDLHDEEFKLPSPKPMPCLTEISSCLDCYKENAKDPLKCAQLVRSFADCARRARQHVGSSAAQPS